MTPAGGDFDFIGAKAAFLLEGRVLALQRDDLPGLPWRGMWDLPGGGRECGETPEDCLLRELEEEFGLRLPAERLLRRWVLPSVSGGALPGVFFAGHLYPSEISAIRFGNEGQRWEMMPVAEFLAHPRAIPAMAARLRMAL